MFRRSTTEYDYLFKVLLVGPSCGKTQLLNRYAKDTFCSTAPPTIGVDFEIKMEDALSTNCKLQIWDTAGHERFRAITRSYFRGAHGVFLCFDITQKSSFEQIKTEFLQDVNEYNDNANVILVGTKLDLKDKREVSTEEATQFASSFGWSYRETSAYLGINVKDVFVSMVEELLISSEFAMDNIFTKSKEDDCLLICDLASSFHQMQVLTNIVEKYKNKTGNMKIKLLDELEKCDICLRVDLKDKMIEEKEEIDEICHVISVLSKSIVEMEIVNRGTQKIFNELKKHFVNLKRCTIDCDKINSDGLMSDYKLFILMAEYIEHIRFEINDKLLDVLIENKDNIWDEFASKLINNLKLRSFGVSIYNTLLNKEVYIKKIADILECITRSKSKICCSLGMTFKGNTKFVQERQILDVLYSGINKCISSKANVINELVINYHNDDDESEVHLFDNVFCQQLLSINYGNLVKLGLNLSEIEWNNKSLNVLGILMKSADRLQEISINGQVFSNTFDVINDTEAIELLMDCIHCNQVTFPIFGSKSIKYCLPSINKFIRSSKTENITLYFESLDFKQIYKLLDSWCDGLHDAYKYYRDLKNYVEKSDCILSEFDEITECILNFCKMKELKLYIDIKNSIISNPKKFVLIDYLYNKLKHILIEENMISDGMDPYDTIISKLSELMEIIFITNNENVAVMVYIDNRPLIMDDCDEYDESKWDFISNIDYKLLCNGYVREFCIKNSKIFIPNPIYGVIWLFYPNRYNIFQIDLDELGPNIKAKKWLKVSAICDNLSLYCLDNRIQFKLLTENEWYDIDENECEISKHLTMDINDKDYKDLLKQFKRDSFFIDLLSRRYDRFDVDCDIALTAAATNYGDVIILRGSEGGMDIYSASNFLLNDTTNKHGIISINSSLNHMLFLTSNGNVFTLGLNDVGQCGIYNNNDSNRINAPFHLKQISAKFIKSTHVGYDFNFCIDKNHNLYCFGNNQYNKLGFIHNDKNIEKLIIWEPIIHQYFNKDITGIIVKKIRCGGNMTCFVDDEFQCYFSGKHVFNKNKSLKKQDIIHWQSLKDEWRNIKIIHAHCIDDINSDKLAICLLDSLNRLTITHNDDTICSQIDGLGNINKIERLYLFPRYFMLVTT